MVSVVFRTPGRATQEAGGGRSGGIFLLSHPSLALVTSGLWALALVTSGLWAMARVTSRLLALARVTSSL